MLMKIVLFIGSQAASERYVQEDQVGVDATVPGVNASDSFAGFSAARAVARANSGDFGGANDKLFFVYFLLCPFRQKDTQESMSMHSTG